MITIEILESLLYFQRYSSREVFIGVFGPVFGPHLWGKFQEEDGNLLRLFSRMDNARATELVERLNSLRRSDVSGISF